MRETKNFSMVNLSQAQGVALPARRQVATEPAVFSGGLPPGAPAVMANQGFDFSRFNQGSFDETFPEEDDEPADIEATPPPVAAAALVEPPQTTLAASLNMARSMSMPQFATGPGRPAALRHQIRLRTGPPASTTRRLSEPQVLG